MAVVSTMYLVPSDPADSNFSGSMTPIAPANGTFILSHQFPAAQPIEFVVGMLQNFIPAVKLMQTAMIPTAIKIEFITPE